MVMGEHSGVFRQSNATQQGDGRCRLEVGSFLRQKNAGDDHVKDEIKNKGVFQTAHEMDEVGQHGEIGEYLDIREPIRLFGRDVQVRILGSLIIQGEEDIIDEQNGVSGIQRQKGHRDAEYEARSGDEKENDRNGNPSQPDEPLKPFIQFLNEKGLRKSDYAQNASSYQMH
jgi:hypothetical protein